MRILLVEDSVRLADTVSAGLARLGHRVDHAADGLTALRFGEERDYDAIVLDLMIPEVDGLSVLKRLRRKGIQTNVLILSAKASVGDRITGLDIGADDYLTKPFSFEELCSRLRAIDRRNREAVQDGTILGPISIDFDRMRVWAGDDVMDFTAGEYAIFEHLARRPGRVINRDVLRACLEHRKEDVASNVVDATICTLRAKLSAAGVNSLIMTHRGRGYSLE